MRIKGLVITASTVLSCATAIAQECSNYTSFYPEATGATLNTTSTATIGSTSSNNTNGTYSNALPHYAPPHATRHNNNTVMVYCPSSEDRLRLKPYVEIAKVLSSTLVPTFHALEDLFSYVFEVPKSVQRYDHISYLWSQIDMEDRTQPVNEFLWSAIHASVLIGTQLPQDIRTCLKVIGATRPSPHKVTVYFEKLLKLVEEITKLIISTTHRSGGEYRHISALLSAYLRKDAICDCLWNSIAPEGYCGNEHFFEGSLSSLDAIIDLNLHDNITCSGLGELVSRISYLEYQLLYDVSRRPASNALLESVLFFHLKDFLHDWQYFSQELAEIFDPSAAIPVAKENMDNMDAGSLFRTELTQSKHFAMVLKMVENLLNEDSGNMFVKWSIAKAAIKGVMEEFNDTRAAGAGVIRQATNDLTRAILGDKGVGYIRGPGLSNVLNIESISFPWMIETLKSIRVKFPEAYGDVLLIYLEMFKSYIKGGDPNSVLSDLNIGPKFNISEYEPKPIINEVPLSEFVGEKHDELIFAHNAFKFSDEAVFKINQALRSTNNSGRELIITLVMLLWLEITKPSN